MHPNLSSHRLRPSDPIITRSEQIKINEIAPQAPVPVQPWRGIRSAENFGPNCPTIDGINTVKADIANGVDVEDCLVMNIYTPSINLLMPKKLYPVMVFIHGGTFSSFTGSDFRSDYILGRKDVVLVVPNYREAALGQ